MSDENKKEESAAPAPKKDVAFKTTEVIAPPEESPDMSAGQKRSGIMSYLFRAVTIRDEPSNLEKCGYALFAILCVILLWHVLTIGAPEERIISAVTLPSLSETFDASAPVYETDATGEKIKVSEGGSLYQLWFDRELSRSAIWSLIRVIGGFVLAIGIGVPLGVNAGAFRRLHAFMRPISVFGRNIPIAALIPLSLIWFGVNEIQKVMFIFIACVAFIFFDTVNSINGVPDKYLDTAYTLGAKYKWRHGLKWSLIIGAAYAFFFGFAYATLVPGAGETVMVRPLVVTSVAGLIIGFALWFPVMSFQVVRKVMLPLAMPDIINSLRLLFGLAFGYIMLAEVINTDRGLGAIINLSQRRGIKEHIYLCLIFIAILAFLIDRLILYAQRKAFPYRTGGEK
ncbi:MAG: ABC transporter permease subunit [Planctomycetes bacterium]|nr:ABC transporter permease subunit [Planctomycetota bacterium]